MAGVSNADIMQAVLGLEGKVGRVEEIALATKVQAERTNGKVADLQSWRISKDAVESYKKDNPAPTTTTINAQNVTVQPKWFENDKLVAAVSVIAVAIAAVLTWVASGGVK